MTGPTLENSKQTTRKAIGVAVVKNKPQVIALLQKYGVVVDNSYGTDELIVGVFQAMASSPGFRRDLAKLLAASMNENKQHFTEDIYNFNAGGPADTSGGSAGDIGQAATSSTISSSSNNNSGSSLFSNANLNNILNTGLTVLSNSLKSKSDQKLANTALQIETQKTQQAALEAAKTGATTAATPMSTGAKIGIAVGVIGLVGGVLYFLVFRKKK